jgi:hypothetical protein
MTSPVDASVKTALFADNEGGAVVGRFDSVANEENVKSGIINAKARTNRIGFLHLDIIRPSGKDTFLFHVYFPGV